MMNLIHTDSVENPKLRKLLKENVIGTPGKSMVYQHKMIDEKLDHLSSPLFVTAKLREEVLGTCCFCKRTIFMYGKEVKAYYIRYFTFRQGFRVATVGPTKRRNKDTLFRTAIGELLSGKYFSETDPHIYYAYIDPGNIRSMQQAEQFGFRQVARFNTVFLSRFFPKRSGQVHRLEDQQKEQILATLKDAYADHAFLSFENIFFKDNYFVLKDQGKIVAGLHANPEQWQVYELPGQNGKFLLEVISRMPLLNRLFNKEFRFLSAEGIFCEPGYEWALEVILEDVMARFRTHSVICCLYPGSPEYRLLKRIRGGVLRKLSVERSFAVVMKTEGVEMPRTEQVYVSAFDVM